jgi:dienelactone hydrolase
VLALATAPAGGQIQDTTVEYRDGDAVLRGHLYWDDRYEGRRPGVLVVHEWWGLNSYARMRARMLAEAGYVAFAPDMYGDDKVTEHPNEAKAWMEQITSNLEAWQQRARAGLEQLKQQPQVDPERLAAIGYCFGGATVLQMAYAGMEVEGVASFHGSLPPATEQQGNIKASILVAHGDADSFVPPERVDAFKAGLRAAGADWEMDIYGGARHSFTVPDAERKGIDNLKYDPKADRRSWQRLIGFLDELFRG